MMIQAGDLAAVSATIRLDGREITGALMADDIAGVVKRYARDDAGGFVTDPIHESLVIETLRGHVEIVLK